MYRPARGREHPPPRGVAAIPPTGTGARHRMEEIVDSNADRGDQPIRVGLIADQTGPLSFVGLANANVARMVIGDINARGGLLGRRLELHLEDGATDDATAAAAAAKLVGEDRVHVLLGGIYSSTRQAIKGPAVVDGKTLYIYPEQYEGQESDPLIFCTGPVPAQQVDPFIPWLMRETGARTFYLPSADYIWPHVLNARVRDVVTANGGSIVGEEYFPLDHTDYAATVERIASSGADVVFNTIVPPGVGPFFQQLHDSGFARDGGQLVCTYFDENFLNMVPAEHVEGLWGCLDYYQAVDDPFSRRLLAQYDAIYPGDAKFTGGGACSGLYRGLRLWAAAVTQAGSLTQEGVIAALDRAEIADGPGGPAAMVPGEHHVRMNMYIARARGGRFEIAESLGAIDPQERQVVAPSLAG
jgi:branched-chain amino acid transport system substrate-binding protein